MLSGLKDGHIRAWDELNKTMQTVLRKAGLANEKGKL